MTMVSTDKAIRPRSVMGASKRVAELTLARWTSKESQMNSIRLGNVYGTEGSVIKLFAQQILAGGPVTVTHADATRYFLTLEEAVDLILLASELAAARILIPDLGEPVRILDLAHNMIEEASFAVVKGIPITFIGLRPGDKMTEDLVSASEFVEPTDDPRLSNVKSTEMHPDRFDALMSASPTPLNAVIFPQYLKRFVVWSPNTSQVNIFFGPWKGLLSLSANKRRIAAVTTSRADYGHLYWPLRDLADNEDVDLKLIALGSHLSSEFGNTIQEIENDGFEIDVRIECLLSSDTDVGMAKTIGNATLSLADLLGHMRPDFASIDR